MRIVRLIGTAAAATTALAACAPRTVAPVPAPPPSQPALPPPAPAPPPPADWRDAALSAGDWAYGQSPGPRATFGAGTPLVVVECTSARQIAFSRIAAVPGPTLIVGTTSGERSLPAVSRSSATVATLAPADALLDEIAFSRGRILVRVDGQPDLILPSWPEPARVIEDCRQ
jgi:hypothetical protein